MVATMRKTTDLSSRPRSSSMCSPKVMRTSASSLFLPALSIRSWIFRSTMASIYKKSDQLPSTSTPDRAPNKKPPGVSARGLWLVLWLLVAFDSQVVHQDVLAQDLD